MVEIKSWDNLNILEDSIEKAVAEHNATLEKLQRNGRPIYSPEVQREHEQKARQTLTASLDRLAEKAAAFKERAEKVAAAGRDDPYSWLSAEELQRAALLRDFVAEDAAVLGVEGLTRLSIEVMAGRRQLDRSVAFLLMREATKTNGVPVDVFARAAMPPELAAADEEIKKAQSLERKIDMYRPEWIERINRNVVGTANYDATGKPIESWVPKNG